MNDVVLVSYGGGTDSTAALIAMIARNEPPPLAILTGNTGGEWPRTYAYIELFSDFLQHYGYPRVTILHRQRRDKTWKSLEQDCLDRGWLPSVAYGWKTCSQKWKVEPQDKFANNHPECKAAWKAGRKVVKVIGYNYGEVHRARFGENEKYRWRYPLIELELTKEKAEHLIRSVGLPLPGKSACFFCPHAKKSEIIQLAEEHPDLAQRALQLEHGARRNTKKVKGLGRKFAWSDVLADYNFQVEEDPYDEKPCGCYD